MTTLSFFVGFAAASLFGPTAKHLKQLLDLSPMQCSWLMAMPLLSGSLLRIPCGAWSDSAGARRPMLGLLCVSVAGMLGVTCLLSQLSVESDVSAVYSWLLVLGTLCGCGIATFSSGISQVSYWFPQASQGKVLGAYAGLGNLSPGLIALVVPWLLEGFGLVDTYVVWLAILMAGTILYFFTGHSAWYFQLRAKKYPRAEAERLAYERCGQELFPEGSALQGLKAAAAAWQTWSLVAVYFVTFGGLVALTNWLITYWSELHGLSQRSAGALAALFSFAGSPIRALLGPATNCAGGERSLLVSLIVVLVGSAMLRASMDFSVDFAGTIIMALGMGVANASVFKLLPQVVPHAVGGAVGWVSGLGAFGGFVIPPAMAAFVQEGRKDGYARGFITIVGLAGVSLLAAGALVCCGCPTTDGLSDSDAHTSASEDDEELSALE